MSSVRPDLSRQLLLRALMAGALACPVKAEAATAMSLSAVTMPIASAVEFETSCQPSYQATAPAAALTTKSAPTSKSAAILGGEMSALERIKAQQAAVVPQATSTIAQSGTPRKMEPTAIGVRIVTQQCASMSSMTDRFEQEAQFVIPGSDDFLGSKRVAISRTGFDQEWQRVRSDAVSANQLRFATRKPRTDLETVQAVNNWVNRSIDYVEDRDLFGRADYWAGASMTVLLGKGDCEDIALTKLQMLAAAGFDRDDMFLTIARDTIRRADHALLVVKIDNRFVVLDNTTDELLDGASSHGYSPVLSFADKQRWVHGYQAKR